MVLAIRNHFPTTETPHKHIIQEAHSHNSDKKIDEKSKDELEELIQTESIKEFDKLPFIHQSTILIQSGRLNELKVLLDSNPTIKDSINTPSKEDGRTLLTRASFGGSIKIIKYIVEELNADINIADAEEITPIMEAISSENYEVSKYLLENGADIHATNKLGADALTMALSGSDELIINELLKKGANPNHQWNNKKMSHLMLASRSGHLQTVKWLLEAGAHINEQDINLNQAIHYASSEGFTAVVKVLIDKGSNKSKKNKLEKTPKALALENNFKEIADLLP